MTDSSDAMPPGWYYAEGDPAGTQRYWDGTAWQGDPQPVGDAPAAGAAPSGGIPSSFGAPGEAGGVTPPSFGAPDTGGAPSFGTPGEVAGSGPSFGTPDTGGASFGGMGAAAAGGAAAVGGAAAGAFGAATGGFGSDQPAYGMGGNQPAEYGQRVIAALIDFAILIGVAIAVGILAAILGAVSDTLGTIVGGLGYLAYFGVLIWNVVFKQGTTGSTIGKAQQGTRLISDSTGQPLGIAGAAIRWLAQAAFSTLTCGIGGLVDVLWPLFDADNKRLTDKWLKNSVVK